MSRAAGGLPVYTRVGVLPTALVSNKDHKVGFEFVGENPEGALSGPPAVDFR